MITKHPDPEPVVREEDVPLVGADVLRLKLIPLATGGDVDVESAANWVAKANAPQPPIVLPLYGTHVVWSPTRAACIGPAERLPQLRDAVVEFARCESALRDLEAGIAEGLVHVDADTAAVFDVDPDEDRRRELAGRYRMAVTCQAGLARLAPRVHVPPLHPPTLASQVAERLRERTRLDERLEFGERQVEVLLRVYEQCGQRVSDAVIGRRHSRLEWAIVVLLAAETLFLLVDLLAWSATPS